MSDRDEGDELLLLEVEIGLWLLLLHKGGKWKGWKGEGWKGEVVGKGK